MFTPHFGAPEVVQRTGSARPRTDAWSFAVLAFKLLTMGHPFLGRRVLEAEDAEAGWDAETEEDGAADRPRRAGVRRAAPVDPGRGGRLELRRHRHPGEPGHHPGSARPLPGDLRARPDGAAPAAGDGAVGLGARAGVRRLADLPGLQRCRSSSTSTLPARTARRRCRGTSWPVGRSARRSTSQVKVHGVSRPGCWRRSRPTAGTRPGTRSRSTSTPGESGRCAGRTTCRRCWSFEFRGGGR